MSKSILTLIGLVITALLAMHLATGVEWNGRQFRLPIVDVLERMSYDVRLRISAKDERDSRVVIIDVDEQSMQNEGQWPWPRATFAKMNDQLFDVYQIDSLGFDITFPEPEDSYTDATIAALVASEDADGEALLAKLRNESGDQVFARSLEGRSVVLGSVFQRQLPDQAKIPSVGVLPQPAFLDAEVDYQTILAETNPPNRDRHTSNIDVLAASAAATGFFSISEEVGDPDGIIRRVELYNRLGDFLYPSLALQLVQGYFFDSAQPLLIDDPDDGYLGLEGLRMIHTDIPLDPQTAVYVPYAEARKAYEYIPAGDIINGTYEGDIAGAIALVGTSAAGLVDLRNTPVAAALPGVEVHANVISALLDGNFRTKPAWVAGVDFLAISVIGIILSILLPRLSALWGTLVFGISGVSAAWINWYFWSEKLMILNLAPILLLVFSLYVMNMVVGFFAESQARRMTQKMFGMYVPPEVVGKMNEVTDVFSMRSEKREMTVLFCDIRDFTTISEGLAPEDLSEWLNDFLTPMTSIIHKYGGAIDKYMGDAIMAFWGAPLADEDHAEHAIRASLEMLEYLDKELNAKFAEVGKPEIRLGVGLNTGMMSVGNMGSEFRMAYTVVGDAVNLGSRLEGLTKQYGVTLIVSEFTRAAAKPEGFYYRELDTVKVKGKNTAVTIYSCEPGDEPEGLADAREDDDTGSGKGSESEAAA